MNISIEISMSPLTKEYEPAILDFIKSLNQYPEISVITNTMSTQIFGPYDTLMMLLTKEIKTAFEANPTVIMAMKIINMDLKP
jgi:uncharacterized protein YqgV (UPF0045/DUF77 family)